MTTRVGITAAAKTATTAKTSTVFDPKVKDVKYATAAPEGFSFDEHKALKKKNFESDTLYYEHRALELEHRAGKFRSKAAEAKKFGTRADQAKAKKVVKLNEKIAELRAALTAQGVDVDALLKAQK